MNKHTINISKCICPVCQNEFPIPRQNGRRRKKNHLKTIWCPFCKKETVMREIRYCDYYKNYYNELIV